MNQQDAKYKIKQKNAGFTELSKCSLDELDTKTLVLFAEALLEKENTIFEKKASGSMDKNQRSLTERATQPDINEPIDKKKASEITTPSPKFDLGWFVGAAAALTILILVVLSALVVKYGFSKDPYAVPDSHQKTTTVRAHSDKGESKNSIRKTTKKNGQKTDPLLPPLRTKFQHGGYFLGKQKHKTKNNLVSPELDRTSFSGLGLKLALTSEYPLSSMGTYALPLKFTAYIKCGFGKDPTSRPTSRPASSIGELAVGQKPKALKKKFVRTYPWPPPANIARVNKVDISANRFLQRYELFKKLWVLENGGIEINELTRHKLRRQSLKSMITDALLYQQACSEGAKLSQNEKTTALNKLKKTFPKGATLQDMLKKNRLTQEAFDLRLNRRLTVKKYTESLLKKINISRQAVSKRYKETVGRAKYKVRHIVVPMAAGASLKTRKATRKRANQIKALAIKGDNTFAELAKQYSDDPSAEDGGALGYLQKGDILEDLNVIFDMKKGEIRGPILSPLGFHIIKVTSVQPAPTLLRAYATILTDMRREKLKAVLQKKIKALQTKADIKILVKWGKGLFSK